MASAPEWVARTESGALMWRSRTNGAEGPNVAPEEGSARRRSPPGVSFGDAGFGCAGCPKVPFAPGVQAPCVFWWSA